MARRHRLVVIDDEERFDRFAGCARKAEHINRLRVVQIAGPNPDFEVRLRNIDGRTYLPRTANLLDGPDNRRPHLSRVFRHAANFTAVHEANIHCSVERCQKRLTAFYTLRYPQQSEGSGRWDCGLKLLTPPFAVRCPALRALRGG
jgi:hypothetical protein